jgi:hypothetical protein
VPEVPLYSYPYASTERLYSEHDLRQRLAASFMSDPGPLVRLQGYEPSKDCDESAITHCKK